MRYALMLVVLSCRGQITAPPAFSDKGGFQKSNSAAALDGASHVSAERAQTNEALVEYLAAWPEAGEGVKLLRGGLLGAAEESFRKAGFTPGEAVTDFLQGKTELAAEAMLRYSEAHPRELRLMPLLGETVGVAQAHSGRMLERLRVYAESNLRSASAQYYLGKALLKQEPPRSNEALPLLKRAAALDLKDTRALLELAREQSAQGARAEAIQSLESALRRDATLAAAHYRLGQLYREAGAIEKSREHLRLYQALKEKK